MIITVNKIRPSRIQFEGYCNELIFKFIYELFDYFNKKTSKIYKQFARKLAALRYGLRRHPRGTGASDGW